MGQVTAPSMLTAMISIFIAAIGCQFDAERAPQPVAPTRTMTVCRGHVVSPDGPVVGATVRLQAEATSTQTGPDGAFELTLPTRDDDTSERRITASKAGFLIAGQTYRGEPLEFRLVPLPTEDNAEYEWVDPRPDETMTHHCGNCHPQIFNQWNDGAHSRSASNRRFLNLYAGTNWHGEEGHGWSFLDEYPEGAGVCTSCHAPSAPLDQMGFGDLRDIQGVAALGVHCDFCHKIQSVVADSEGLTHGRFATRLLRPHDDQLFFGPLDDVDRGEDSFLSLQKESQLCATCHEGVVFGVPVYTTYSEWQTSQAARDGKACQSCHMKPDGVMTNIAPGFGGLERHPETLGSHQLLPGGKAGMLKRCLDVQVLTSTTETSHSVKVRLTTHDVGHYVPTGFVDRHLILIVEALDSQGQALEVVDGPVLPQLAGEFAALPGQIFAKQLRSEAGTTPVPFWNGDVLVEDNRLPPDTTRDIDFQFPLQAQRIRVRLLYRRFWSETRQSKDWPDDTIVIYDAHRPIDEQ